MDRFVTLHRCLLALLLVWVQLALPVSATAAMFEDGVAAHDICSVAAPASTADPAAPQDAAGLPGHAHCALCGGPLTALPPQAAVPLPPDAPPRRLLRAGDAPALPHAFAAAVPARGPPASA